MAERRMFAKSVINSARFLRMPQTSRLLYYDLGMSADDDGVVEAFTVIRTTGAAEDDLRVLATRGFITVLNDDLVSYITDWSRNNYIQKDRYRPSIYNKLLVKLGDGNQSATDWQPSGDVTDTVCIQPVSNMDTQVRLGKDSLDKNRLDNNITSNVILSGAETAPAPNTAPDASGILLSLVDKTDYDVPLSKIEEWKEAYPAVDIEPELKKMSAWLNANPSRKKTRRGINRFINTWLSREQDKGGRYRVSNYNGQNGGNGISEAARHEAEQRAAYGKY